VRQSRLLPDEAAWRDRQDLAKVFADGASAVKLVVALLRPLVERVVKEALRLRELEILEDDLQV
jgi:hypothetical protein